MKPEEECSDYQPDPWPLVMPFYREKQDKLEAARELIEKAHPTVFIPPVRA